MPTHVFVIESELPNSTTSVRNQWESIRSMLASNGQLGKSCFLQAPTKADIQLASHSFRAWANALPDDGPIVLWLSVHGQLHPEIGVPNAKRKIVGISGKSSMDESIEWIDFFEPVKKARNAARVVVLMDVCWGSSPTAPARLSTPARNRPAFLFGPVRRANRSELDIASGSVFQLIGKMEIPDADKAKCVVDEINWVISGDESATKPFYRVWWWNEDGTLLRYPDSIVTGACAVKRK